MFSLRDRKGLVGRLYDVVGKGMLVGIATITAAVAVACASPQNRTPSTIPPQLEQGVYRTDELTLENARRSSDVRFVQAYVDRLVGSGKVQLGDTPVVYDPDFSKELSYWERLLSQHPERHDKIQSYVKDAKDKRSEFNKFMEEYKKGAPKGGAGFMSTSGLRGVPGTTIFVHGLAPFFGSDDDILWHLEHERCHIPRELLYALDIPTQHHNPESIRLMQAMLDTTEADEVNCYSHQFKESGRFNLTPSNFDAALVGFRMFYDRLLKLVDNDIERIVIEQLHEKGYIISPYQLQFRQN